MDEASDTLGFVPQKVSVYNKLLPYADKLDEESIEQLSVIKANLGRAVQLRDLKVGCTHWTSQLSKYIRLYGMKFSKDDHLAFIHLAYELISIPELDMTLVQKFSNLLITLLKKKELLSRDDLTLKWRPLYELVHSVVYSQYEHHGLQLFPVNIESTLKKLICACRVYFSNGATQEMLDEWRPLLCPTDTSMQQGMFYIEHFLPTTLPPDFHHKGFKLWFEEMIGIWTSCQSSPSWEMHLVNLFSRLADDNIGYITWDPYIPMIFTRFLRSFNLPVGSGSVQIGRTNNAYDVSTTVTWIVAMMGGSNRCQEELKRLFTAIESFYHPSNNGKWHGKLFSLMHLLPKELVKRIHRERKKKPSWLTQIPASHHLCDSSITAFVECLVPIVSLAMFSKVGSHDAAAAFHHLAVLRPELIIPPLLEKTYPALETLTEPHRLIACLNCIVSVCRSMLQDTKYYSEGRSHVLPLLNLCLPGIDANDIKKCLTTFQLISTLASLVPLVDCSDAVHRRSDLTEEEREVCSASAQFEDFVLQFMDKVFGLIESSSRLDSSGVDKLNQEEAVLEVGLLSAFNSILQQSSAVIYKQALNRLFNFVSTRFFEIRVAGRFTADLCRTAAKVDAGATLKKFVPHFCEAVLSRISSEDISKDEHLDTEFLWNLKVLSEIVRCDGTALLPFKDSLIAVLSGTLNLRCIEAANLAGNLLRHTLKALTLTYALDYRSVATSWDQPVEDYLAIRDWGKPGDIHDLQLKWHIPNDEENAFARDLLNYFLVKQLDKVKKHTSKEDTLEREALAQTLSIITNCIFGAGMVLPVWKSEKVQLLESQVDLLRFKNTASASNEGITIDGQNIRELVLDTLKPFLEHMLASSEDDTKSLLQLLRLYKTILFYHGTEKDSFDNRWKSIHIVKKSMENKLLGKKNHIRALLVDRVQLQHELRVQHSHAKNFTRKHQEIFQDLFRLSISRYPEVRKKAQSVLGQGFHQYAYSYLSVIHDIVKYLSNDPEVQHHQFKGALYVILGEKKTSLMSKRKWDIMNVMWPALVQAQHSEKPSILKLVDQIASKVHQHVEATEINIQVTDSCIVKAGKLWENKPHPTCSPPGQDEKKVAARLEEERNADCLRQYHQLVNKLVQLIEGGTLAWKFSQMAIEMLGLLVRHDTPLVAPAVRIYVRNLTHEVIQVRKICVNAVSAILKQQKRKHKKLTVDPYKVSGCSPPADSNDLHPGDRPDNRWLLYCKENVPDTKEKWEAFPFVEKTHWGFYTWPKPMHIYAPPTEQPPLDRKREELTEAEQVIYDFFNDDKQLEKLIGFLSLEENKGKDKFHPRHFTLFKGLFRNYGDTFVPKFKPIVERLATDTKHETHETNQRCAAEIISGILRGSKHWPYEKVRRMWEWLMPILRSVIPAVTTESVTDWGTCFATVSESRDPHKMSPLLELLVDNPLKGVGGSFGDASRLYLLQGALSQQEWRVPTLLHSLLEYIEPYLTHPYKNVRDRLGSVLTSIFMYDFTMLNGGPESSPKKPDFINKIIAQLEPVKNSYLAASVESKSSIKPQKLVNSNVGRSLNSYFSPTSHMVFATDGFSSSSKVSNSREPMDVDGHDDKVKAENEVEMNVLDDKADKEKKEAIRLCKTVMKWIQGSFGRMLQCAPPEIFQFLPVLSMLASETTDDELRQDCAISLACMAQSLLNPEVIPVVLNTIKEVCTLRSWHARAAILAYTQMMVFCNLFLVQDQHCVSTVREMVLQLLSDEQLEVREIAAVTLSGFLRCGYITMDKQLMEHFEKWSRTKIKKRSGSNGVSQEKLIKRHAGVLGLSACIQAFPYDVPEFMPQVLMDLSDHLDDPQPIQATVKKTLSNFRRTHHDNWQDHKQKFTDDQLVVLTDLLVSPNYYA